MAIRGHLAFFLVACMAAPLSSQQTPQQTMDERVQQLEKRLDDLSKQMADVRQQLDQIKGGGQPPPAAQPSDDLTKIDTVTPAAPANSLTDVQTVNNVPNPSASKVFNPDTSVIGNFIGKTGQVNPYEFGSGNERPPFGLDKAEVAFQAYVDPYSKANVFLSITPSGIDVEEGYANFVTLPYDLTAKVGKMKAYFGKDNTWHTHVRPWVDQPLVIHNFFGDEGLADEGVSVSKTIDNPFNTFIEATGEVFSGNVGDVFKRQSNNDLLYNAHLKAFRDLTEDSNLEVGTSYATGKREGARNSFGGVDVTYRWKPLQQGLYRGLIGRFEGLTNDAEGERRANGFYASADYQLGQRWSETDKVDPAIAIRETERIVHANSEEAYKAAVAAGPGSRGAGYAAWELISFDRPYELEGDRLGRVAEYVAEWLSRDDTYAPEAWGNTFFIDSRDGHCTAS